MEQAKGAFTISICANWPRIHCTAWLSLGVVISSKQALGLDMLQIGNSQHLANCMDCTQII